MELLERYLQSVRTYLIRHRRDDIGKEMGDNILGRSKATKPPRNTQMEFFRSWLWTY
jgi:hypothetical protein